MPKTSSTSSSKGWRAGLYTVLILLMLGAGLARGLDAILYGQPTSIHPLIELERRIEAFPHPERVRLLVIGNSHAVAGLRPPQLAETLQLGPGEVFSLAVPSASVHEMSLLIERHLARFPRARTVLCGVDERFLGTRTELRMRYLTRDRLDLRWHYAMAQPTLDQRLGLLGSWFVPWADFAQPLGARVKALLRPSPPEGTVDERIGRLRYAWGYPPPWAYFDADSEAARARARAPWRVAMRAATSVATLAAAPEGMAALKDLGGRLAESGRQLVLVEMPYLPRFEAAIRSQKPDAYRRYRAVMDQAWQDDALPNIAAPHGFRDEDFYDTDHMTEQAALKLARWVARAPHVLSR